MLKSVLILVGEERKKTSAHARKSSGPQTSDDSQLPITCRILLQQVDLQVDRLWPCCRDRHDLGTYPGTRIATICVSCTHVLRQPRSWLSEWSAGDHYCSIVHDTRFLLAYRSPKFSSGPNPRIFIHTFGAMHVSTQNHLNGCHECRRSSGCTGAKAGSTRHGLSAACSRRGAL